MRGGTGGRNVYLLIRSRQRHAPRVSYWYSLAFELSLVRRHPLVQLTDLSLLCRNDLACHGLEFAGLAVRNLGLGHFERLFMVHLHPHGEAPIGITGGLHYLHAVHTIHMELCIWSEPCVSSLAIPVAIAAPLADGIFEAAATLRVGRGGKRQCKRCSGRKRKERM